MSGLNRYAAVFNQSFPGQINFDVLINCRMYHQLRTPLRPPLYVYLFDATVLVLVIVQADCIVN